MILKFDETGSATVRSGIVRKLVSEEVITEPHVRSPPGQREPLLVVVTAPEMLRENGI